jgi:hypothetical protein
MAGDVVIALLDTEFGQHNERIKAKKIAGSWLTEVGFCYVVMNAAKWASLRDIKPSEYNSKLGMNVQCWRIKQADNVPKVRALYGPKSFYRGNDKIQTMTIEKARQNMTEFLNHLARKNMRIVWVGHSIHSDIAELGSAGFTCFGERFSNSVAYDTQWFHKIKYGKKPRLEELVASELGNWKTGPYHNSANDAVMTSHIFLAKADQQLYSKPVKPIAVLNRSR